MHHRPSGHLDGMLAHQDFAQFPSDRSMVLSSHWLLHVVFGPSCRQHQPTTLVLDDIGVCPGPLHWHGGVCGAPEARSHSFGETPPAILQRVAFGTAALQSGAGALHGSWAATGFLEVL